MIFSCFKCFFDDVDYAIYIKFKFELKDKKINKIRLFGGDFVTNNRKRKILYNKKELKLEEFIPIKNANQKELEIQLKSINKINSMKNMFCSCKFKSIIFFHKNLEINISTITNMFGMFYDCRELEYIDLSIFDTSKVTNMNFMFHNCHKLKKIKGIENFNTEQVINMGRMFFGCRELEFLDLSSFDK